MNSIFRNYLGDAILLVLIGLFLFLRPFGTMNLVSRLLGIIMLIMGVMKVVVYFSGSAERNTMPFLLGVLQSIAGVTLILRPGFFIRFFPLVAGLMIGYGAIVSLVKLLQIRSYGISLYTPEVIMAIVTLLLAVIVILHPALISASIVQVIGVSLILEGITLFLSMMRIRSQMRM